MKEEFIRLLLVSSTISFEGGEVQMRRLTKNSGLQACLNANRFLQVQLGSNPKTLHLVDRIRLNISKVKKAEGTYQDAKIKRMVLTASIQYQSKTIYSGLMKISRGLLYELNGNSKDALYTRLFPKSPSSLLRQKTLQDQRRIYKQIIEIIQTEDEYEKYRDNLPEVVEAFDALNRNSEELDGVFNAEKRAANERNIAIQEANGDDNFMEHELALIFPTNAKLVETFFYASSSKRADSSDSADKLKASRAAFEKEKKLFEAEKRAFELAKKEFLSANARTFSATATADLDPDESADFNFEDVPKAEELDD